MKRTALDHPKVKRLARLLRLPHYGAVGVLECLWHFTAKHAIRGDLGKWPDETIADAVDWPQERAAELIAALLDSRLLDAHAVYRLVIHDWHDHADESTKKTLAKHKLTFASAEISPADHVTPSPADEHSRIILERSPNDHLSLSTAGAGAGALAKAGAGAGSKPKRARTNPAGALASITEEILRDTKALLEWNRARLGIEPSAADQLFIVSAAERAIEPGKGRKNPASVFVDLVKNDRRDFINGKHEDGAAARLKLHAASNGGASLEATTLAERLKMRSDQ